METNPAIYIALLGAVLTLCSVFGVALTEGKTQAIMGLATVAIPLLIGVITRRNVYSPASAQTALNMPAGASMNLLNKVLETGVRVSPGDTKVEVADKVAHAERVNS